jgi:GNAT superfamily N-acetyltransferase
MIQILSSEAKPEYLDELRNLFEGEWGKIDSFYGNEFRDNPPLPLIALKDKKLIGGLSYSWNRPEDFTKITLWINGVYVNPLFRRTDIGTSLIKASVTYAKGKNEQALYAYTHIPELYMQQG